MLYKHHDENADDEDSNIQDVPDVDLTEVRNELSEHTAHNIVQSNLAPEFDHNFIQTLLHKLIMLKNVWTDKTVEDLVCC